MPCRDYYDDHPNSQPDSSEVIRLKARNDMLARIACKSLDLIEEHLATQEGTDPDAVIDQLLDKEERKWWANHKAQEFRRRQKEADARAAKMKQLISEMSAEEIAELKKQIK